MFGFEVFFFEFIVTFAFLIPVIELLTKAKFTTKNGTHVSACETNTEEKAWLWISKVKDLTLKQSKDLYNIKKLD